MLPIFTSTLKVLCGEPEAPSTLKPPIVGYFLPNDPG